MSGLCKECGNPGRYSDACKTCADRPSSQTKSIFVQSAEELDAAVISLRRLWLDLEHTLEHDASCSDCFFDGNGMAGGIKKWLESRDAAQRQAGREEGYKQGLSDGIEIAPKELGKRYAAVVDAARKLRPWAEAFRDGYSIHESQEADAIDDIEAFDKALREIDEAKGGPHA